MNDLYKDVYRYMKSVSRPYIYFWIILTTVFMTSLAVSSYIDEFRQDSHFKLPIHVITDYKEATPNKYTRNVDQNKPRHGENQIFFVESSCAVSPKGYETLEPAVVLSNIQACAIESAGDANPDALVYLFYTCPMDAKSLNRSSDIVQSLFRRPNVFVWHENMESFFKDTPLEDFFVENSLRWSFYPKLHASEVLRTLILWKYGGTYLDLDVVSKRPLSDLGSDFFSRREHGVIGYEAAKLSGTRLGKKIAEKLVNSLKGDFRGHLAKYNGPEMITRVLKEHCNEDKVENFSKEKCGNLSVLPAIVFNPSERDEGREGQYANFVEHGVHLSSYFRKGDLSSSDSSQKIEELMQKYCPAVYKGRGVVSV